MQQKSYLYAATFPLSTTLHLTNDSTWLLPFSVTPLIGVETRNDNNVVYGFTPPPTFVLGQLPLSGRVNRARSTFAYGVTADATVRWIVNDTLSAYAGMRVQYINGQDTYLAYGPLVGMSARFGGK